jgi:CRP-like cAMP-binding protein
MLYYWGYMNAVKEKYYTYFKHFIDAIYPLPELVSEDFFRLCKTRHYKKGSFFIRAGDITSRMGLSLNGYFRLFYLSENGREFTKGFTPPGMFVTSYSAILESRETYFSIEALEDCDVLEFDYNDLIVLSEKNIDLLKMILKLVERVYIMKEKREHHLLQLSASERYRIFSQEHPELEKLVKSYHVASYLGITPEALSRIRKKSKKPKN